MNQKQSAEPSLPLADYDDDDENIVNHNIQGGSVARMYAGSQAARIGGGSSNASRDPSGDPPPQTN